MSFQDCPLAQMRLELGECHFDRVEIGAVGRQEQEPCAPGSDGLLGHRAFMGGEVVENDDVALFERRGKLRRDIGLEDAAVHRGIDDKGRRQAVASAARR